MFSFLCKTLVRVRFSSEVSPITSIHLLQALKYTSVDVNPNSFTVSYLINSCGLSPETARSVSKLVNFETPKKPDLVLAFLKKQGFSESEIQYMIQRIPGLLLSHPEKSLLPKLEFFHSKCVPSNEIAKICCKEPNILQRSVQKLIIPNYGFLKSLLKSEEKTIASIKHYPRIIADGHKNLLTTFKMLRDVGVPECNIAIFLHHNPKMFAMSHKRFKEVMEVVMKMGFHPSRFHFVRAILVMRSMTKSTWQRKLDAYKNWGWSEKVTIDAFRRHPSCMTLSEGKLNVIMKFFVEELGWEPLQLPKSPALLPLSLEKRYTPRASVLKFLNQKGLYHKGFPVKPFTLTEPMFLNKFVHPYLAKAPQLLNLYHGKNG